MLTIILINLALLSTPGVDWNHTVIDSSGNVGLLDFCFDEWDLPHIAYEKDGYICYAHRVAGEWSWSTEQVGVGNEPSVGVMPGGDPVVSYSSSFNQITIASKLDEEWSYETYSDYDDKLTEPVMAVSSDGIIHMVYFRWKYGYPFELRYVNSGAAGWDPFEIESNYDDDVISTRVSLDISPSGYARASAIKIFIDDKGDFYSLKLYEQRPAGWFNTINIASGSCRGRPGISAISDSLTGICYVWNSPDGIRYNQYPGGLSTVYQGNCYFPELDTDSEGNPHIVFLDGATVVYVTNEGVQPLPEFTDTWYSVDIELDEYDQPHIAFNDDDYLNYLWYGDPTGIEEENNSSSSPLITSIFPSPASNQISVRTNPDIEGQLALAIYDLSGRAVIQTNTEESITSIDISQLAAGVYCVKASNQNHSEARMFVKMHL